MKILYIANARIPTEKAHGVQITKMCETFASLGHEVTLVVPKRKTHITDDPYTYYGIKNNFTIVRLPVLDLVPWGKWGFLIELLTFTFSATLYALRQNAEVIYSRDETAVSLLTFAKTPVFLEVHVKKTHRLFRWVSKRCRGIVVISKGLHDLYREMLGEIPIFVAHDGVDQKGGTQTEVGVHTNLPKPVIAYVGKYKTMGEEKGVKEIIAAVALVRKEFPSTSLLFVGLNDDEVSEVEAELENEQIGPEHYQLVTHVPRPEAIAYMEAADVLVMNYPNTEHYAKFMSPLKLFEYMGAGKPIVAPALPSIQEVLSEETAFLFEPDSISDMARAIMASVGDEVVVNKKVSATQELLDTYSWKNRAAQIAAFIEGH